MNKSDNIDLCDKLDKIRNHPHGKRIYETVGMHCNNVSDAKKIAKHLNDSGYKPFSGNERWTKEEVLEILDEVCNNRFLYFKVVCEL